MYLASEAAAMLRAGRVLIGAAPERVEIGRSERGGYVLTRDGGEQVRVKTAKAALRLFREVAGRQGVVAALDKHRYSYLFPAGSSLDWSMSRDSIRAAS